VSASKELRQALKSLRAARSSIRFAQTLNPMSEELRSDCKERWRLLLLDETEIQRLIARAEREDTQRRLERRARPAA
jgi:hypothetical protein